MIDRQVGEQTEQQETNLMRRINDYLPPRHQIHKARREEIVDLGLYYVKDHYAQDIVVSGIDDLEKFLQQCEDENEF
jgi:hypothetical protein